MALSFVAISCGEKEFQPDTNDSIEAGTDSTFKV